RGLGLAYRRKGEVDKAIRELRKAVVENGNDTHARAALGEALLADGAGATQDEARRHLERAAEDPDAPGVTFLALGRLALADGNPSIATRHFARAKDLGEGIDALIGLGDAALAEGDRGSAQTANQYFLQALAIEPRRADLHARIAETHRKI